MKVVITIDVPTATTDSIDVHLFCDDLQETIKQHIAFYKKDWRENEKHVYTGTEGRDEKERVHETLRLIDEMYNSVSIMVWGNKLEIEAAKDKQ